FSDSLGNTLLVGLTVAGLTVMTGVLLNVALKRRRLPSGLDMALEVAALAPYALPPALIGLALIALVNQPGPLGALYSSPLALALAYMALGLPFALKGTEAALRAVPLEMEGSARLDGAGPAALLRRILWPLVAPEALVAGGLVFLIITRDVSAAALLHPPGFRLASQELYDLFHTGPAYLTHALAVMIVAMNALAAVGVWTAVSVLRNRSRDPGPKDRRRRVSSTSCPQ
ncbi:MAG: hypothetical protein C4321_10420, partial [Chloroflexota bacterium]